MTAVDHAELKRLAEDCARKADKLGCDEWRAPELLKRASSGLTALLSEIEGLKAERDAYRDAAHLEAVDCDAAEAALRSQAPDSWRPDREAVAALVKAAATEGIRSYCLEYDFNLELWTDKAMRDLALRPQTAESGK